MTLVISGFRVVEISVGVLVNICCLLLTITHSVKKFSNHSLYHPSLLFSGHFYFFLVKLLSPFHRHLLRYFPGNFEI